MVLFIVVVFFFRAQLDQECSVLRKEGIRHLNLWMDCFGCAAVKESFESDLQKMSDGNRALEAELSSLKEMSQEQAEQLKKVEFLI
jgi:hypothetical protein